MAVGDTGKPREAQRRFEAIFIANYADVLRFIERRAQRDAAEDIMAEVMTTAWRRLSDVPDDPEGARAWLFKAARLTLQNARRRDLRDADLRVRLVELRDLDEKTSLSASDVRADLIDLSAAWRLLSGSQQEVIALSVMDALSAKEAGRVLGISAAAYRLRISRARRALKAILENTNGADAPTASSPFVRSQA